MANNWFFSSNDNGSITGIGEAGIETFKGAPYRSLAREICQNSIDARNDEQLPVKIEFSFFEIDRQEMPGFQKLSESINCCLDFWKEQNNKKTIDFFVQAKKVMEKPIIPVLRISDANTKGLQGSDKDCNTPWLNLVKATGVSSKEGAAGGSFGIGKSAPFVCSDLRTLFYATKDIDGLLASQGIAKLVSFKDKKLDENKSYITTGIGYYSPDNNKGPIKDCVSLDHDYRRQEYGTDIYIIGFNGERVVPLGKWRDEIIVSVLEDFLLAIHCGELVVNVDNTCIDKDSLKDLVEKYKNDSEIAYNYYQVLTDEQSKVIEYEFPNLGKIELRVLLKPGMHRKVMLSRKNGMKIFDKGNISGCINFAGVCMLKDNGINSYFREMENPQHNNWEPDRHPDGKTKADNNRKALFRYIKDKVNELGNEVSLEEMDAEGMGEYFADISTESIGSENQSESITDKTIRITSSTYMPLSSDAGYEKEATYNDEFVEDSDVNSTQEELGMFGSKDQHDDFPNKTHEGTGFGVGEGDNPGKNSHFGNGFQTDIFGEDNSTLKEESKMPLRLFSSREDTDSYNLIFVPQKSYGNGYLQVHIAGEQTKINASVSRAYDQINGRNLPFKKNRIYINDIHPKHKYKISFSLTDGNEYSLEVVLYACQ